MTETHLLSRRMAALLPKIIREFTKRETHAFARGQISVPQLLILEYLQEHSGCIMRELAGSLSVTTGAVTGLVDRLERSRLVRRVRDPQDRRAIRIEATPQGLAVIRDVLQQKERLFRQVLERLQPAQRRLYVQLMEQIYRQLTERRAS